MNNTYAIILAGGNGERFWPLSTLERPKQFVELFGGKPLIRHAADRLKGLIPPAHTLVITAERLVAQTRKALPNIPRANILGEPCRRDTAAAVAVACGLVKRLGGPNAVGCILTADQLMTPEKDFRATLRDAIRAATHGQSIVTIGIQPTYPATGFGYIECAKPFPYGGKTPCHQVKRFVEKPDAAKAKRYLATKRFLWNAGMFVWQERTLESAFAAAAPDIAALINRIAATQNAGRVLKRDYPALRATSFDYAVMEKTDKILVLRASFTWDDVGSYLAIPNHFAADAKGNVALGKAVLRDTTDSIVVTDGDHTTAVIGIRDAVVIHTPNATLVCTKDRLDTLRDVVRGMSR